MFLFDIMPDLNEFEFDSIETMFVALGLNKTDIKEIDKIKVPIFVHKEKIEVAGEGKAPRAKTEKKKTITTSKGGARRSKYGRTRKNRKTSH
jgi:hypothetical protein